MITKQFFYNTLKKKKKYKVYRERFSKKRFRRRFRKKLLEIFKNNRRKNIWFPSRNGRLFGLTTFVGLEVVYGRKELKEIAVITNHLKSKIWGNRILKASTKEADWSLLIDRVTSLKINWICLFDLKQQKDCSYIPLNIH